MRPPNRDTRNALRAPPGMRQVLNVGSGAPSPTSLYPAFRGEGWREVRFDIDASVQPDIVGSLLDLSNFIAEASFDAVWCSHALEHLYTHEVVPALRQIQLALAPTGFALISSPDLKAVASFMVENEVEAIAYESRTGPIRALDMLYGHARLIAKGHTYMAHRTGFTRERLGRVALDAGFAEARVLEGAHFDLWALLLMPEADQDALGELFEATPLRALFDEENVGEYEIDFNRGSRA